MTTILLTLFVLVMVWILYRCHMDTLEIDALMKHMDEADRKLHELRNRKIIVVRR